MAVNLRYFYSCRSIEYKINERHQFHVVAKAQVVPVALELSCDTIILKPTTSMAAESGKTTFIISAITGEKKLFKQDVTLVERRYFWIQVLETNG